MTQPEPVKQSVYCVCGGSGSITLHTCLLGATHIVDALWTGLVSLPCPGVGNEEDS